MIYAEQCEWTDQERETIRKECKAAGLLQNVKESRYQVEEFPEVENIIIERPVPPSPGSQMNRKRRRKLEARERKRRR